MGCAIARLRSRRSRRQWPRALAGNGRLLVMRAPPVGKSALLGMGRTGGSPRRRGAHSHALRRRLFLSAGVPRNVACARPPRGTRLASSTSAARSGIPLAGEICGRAALQERCALIALHPWSVLAGRSARPAASRSAPLCSKSSSRALTGRNTTLPEARRRGRRRCRPGCRNRRTAAGEARQQTWGLGQPRARAGPRSPAVRRAPPQPGRTAPTRASG